MLNVAEKMKHLNEMAKRHPKEQIKMNLFYLVTRRIWLAQAWEEIRRNKGSQTAGIDGTIAQDITTDLIKNLAEKLRTRKYRPKPVRRVYIPKANGKMRPLGIPTIEDRIIQQALKMALEPIFEADFYDCSQGFRKKRNTYRALRDVVSRYSYTNWTIEGDIEGCYDNIPHNKLMLQVQKRIKDKRILRLIRLFLKAGYLENWQYHKTYSGTPQGGIISPLLANIYLHQLDEFMIGELKANKRQTEKEIQARQNPEYKKIGNGIATLRRKLKDKRDKGRTEEAKKLRELERQLKRTPTYDRNKRHPSKIGYVRYADDFVTLVNGTKEETKVIKEQIKQKLQEMGLEMGEEKTKITHWSKPILFLGYEIKGRKKKEKGTRRATLRIPKAKIRRVTEEIKGISRYHYIPEEDIMIQLGAIYRGWCNYYKYANSPQKEFNRIGRRTWWSYAHYLARKQRTSIKKMIIREKKGNRLRVVERRGRKIQTFTKQISNRGIYLDILPPKTGQIWAIGNKGDWTVDLKPVIPKNWQSGRSLATRIAAIEKANGMCQRCKENPAQHVHHIIPLGKKRSFIARMMSDKSQRETITALCKGCHLEAHNGSFRPRRQKSGWNAEYAERCSLSVGNASCKPNYRKVVKAA